MTDQILSQLVSLTVAGVFGIVAGYLGGKVRRLTTRDKAIEEGVKSILRHELMDDYELYAVHGAPLTMERRREIDECYHAYATLGGNGTGKTAYEAICGLDLTI